jgi:antitoxin (DNA-binding transcriptional repressor) of toxin-antitoxin stability system
MKSITIRDLRQRWPEAEALLQVESELLITRDSVPVAKLVRYSEPAKPRKRFDPTAHARWQMKMSEGKVVRLVDKYLLTDRQDHSVRTREA